MRYVTVSRAGRVIEVRGTRRNQAALAVTAILRRRDDLHAVIRCACREKAELAWVRPPKPAELITALRGWQVEHICRGLV